MTVSGRFVFADSCGMGAGGFEPPFVDFAPKHWENVAFLALRTEQSFAVCL
jgi:hypothetical protein